MLYPQKYKLEEQTFLFFPQHSILSSFCSDKQFPGCSVTVVCIRGCASPENEYIRSFSNHELSEEETCH